MTKYSDQNTWLQSPCSSTWSREHLYQPEMRSTMKYCQFYRFRDDNHPDGNLPVGGVLESRGLPHPQVLQPLPIKL